MRDVVEVATWVGRWVGGQVGSSYLSGDAKRLRANVQRQAGVGWWLSGKRGELS